jgi:hypothetical protein
MKTTLIQRQTIANPRRTTLAHLKDASGLVAAATAARAGDQESGPAGEAAGAAARPLPVRTANPRRTVLTELPAAPAAS